MVGDGSYLMMNSEIATSVMLGLKLTSCCSTTAATAASTACSRQAAARPFNNLLVDTRHVTLPAIDFVAHARSLGAEALKVASIADLEAAFDGARAAPRHPGDRDRHRRRPSTDAGGFWWDVAVPEVSVRPQVETALKGYEDKRRRQRAVN